MYSVSYELGIGTMTKLSEAEIAMRLDKSNGWARQGNSICKTFAFSSFTEVVQFIILLGSKAALVGHHPDVDIRNNQVKLMLTTHEAGGLTDSDFCLAETLDRAIAKPYATA
jgi:4a-hydroxytetrahydrobiopterin dehydratase